MSSFALVDDDDSLQAVPRPSKYHGEKCRAGCMIEKPPQVGEVLYYFPDKTKIFNRRVDDKMRSLIQHPVIVLSPEPQLTIFQDSENTSYYRCAFVTSSRRVHKLKPHQKLLVDLIDSWTYITRSLSYYWWWKGNSTATKEGLFPDYSLHRVCTEDDNGDTIEDPIRVRLTSQYLAELVDRDLEPMSVARRLPTLQHQNVSAAPTTVEPDTSSAESTDASESSHDSVSTAKTSLESVFDGVDQDGDDIYGDQ